MSKENVIIEDIPIILERKNIKHMYLRVLTPDGNVKISAPYNADIDEINSFIKSKKEWILEKQKLILNNNIQSPPQYKTGEKHLLWGKKHTLQLVLKNQLKTAIADDENQIIYLPVPKKK